MWLPLILLAVAIKGSSPRLKRDLADGQLLDRCRCGAWVCRCSWPPLQRVGFDGEGIHRCRIGAVKLHQAFVAGVRWNPDSNLPGRSTQLAAGSLAEGRYTEAQQHEQHALVGH